MLSQQRLREIAWEIGQHYPTELSIEYIALAMVTPRLGLVHWHIQEKSVKAAMAKEGLPHASLVVRVYDVSDILFDGTNAHSFFDIEVGSRAGNYYFDLPQPSRNYLAELGLRSSSGCFVSLVRSSPVFFERDRPAGNYQTMGLFVSGALQRVFPVENVFDAKIFEKMHQALVEIKTLKTLAIALVFTDFDQPPASPLRSFIRNSLTQGIAKLGGQPYLFPLCLEATDRFESKALIDKMATFAKSLIEGLAAVQRENPSTLIHCHDWYSAACALEAAEQLHLPLVLSLHSTEHERTHGFETNHVSETVCAWERRVVQKACLVITPHSSTRQQVINLYEAAPDKVVIIQDPLLEKTHEETINPAQVKVGLGLNPDTPLGLFAGEVCHAAGADLLLEALIYVCHRHPQLQFVFAGDGPLKGELEARAWHSGIGQRVRFLGDVPSRTFSSLLAAVDFVVIPARTWQDEGLAQMAIDAGKPVLTTHQAGIRCIVHGQNGLLTYDNPGSLIWGIQELLHNSPQGNLTRIAARKRADKEISLANIVAQHYMHYAIAFKNIGNTYG
ncbi:MAG: DUF4912 domain-containing protein [Methylohalobius sp.]|nr:DUF4912 domain-containing protein [Methylohalobius sp.]